MGKNEINNKASTSLLANKINPINKQNNQNKEKRKKSNRNPLQRIAKLIQVLANIMILRVKITVRLICSTMKIQIKIILNTMSKIITLQIKITMRQWKLMKCTVWSMRCIPALSLPHCEFFFWTKSMSSRIVLVQWMRCLIT